LKLIKNPAVVTGAIPFLVIDAAGEMAAGIFRPNGTERGFKSSYRKEFVRAWRAPDPWFAI
jgi:hypothetical protein